MKNIKWLVLILIFTSISCTKTKNHESENVIAEFFKVYEQAGVNDAVDYLFKTNDWINHNDSSVIDLKRQLTSLLSDLGPYHGYEVVAKRSLGADYCLFSVLAKYERQPLRFTFIIYTINGNSKLQKFKYDVDYDYELEKASEAYFLKENY